MYEKLDAAIGALVDALAQLPEHEREDWQRGNRLGLRVLVRAWPALSRPGAGDGADTAQVGLSPSPLRPAPRRNLMSDAAKRANQSRWTVLDHDPDRAKRHDLSARGTMPELWLCVDCGLNTAPGMPDRKQADLAHRDLRRD